MRRDKRRHTVKTPEAEGASSSARPNLWLWKSGQTEPQKKRKKLAQVHSNLVGTTLQSFNFCLVLLSIWQLLATFSSRFKSYMFSVYNLDNSKKNSFEILPLTGNISTYMVVLKTSSQILCYLPPSRDGSIPSSWHRDGLVLATESNREGCREGWSMTPSTGS